MSVVYWVLREGGVIGAFFDEDKAVRKAEEFEAVVCTSPILIDLRESASGGVVDEPS